MELISIVAISVLSFLLVVAFGYILICHWSFNLLKESHDGILAKHGKLLSILSGLVHKDSQTYGEKVKKHFIYDKFCIGWETYATYLTKLLLDNDFEIKPIPHSFDDSLINQIIDIKLAHIYAYKGSGAYSYYLRSIKNGSVVVVSGSPMQILAQKGDEYELRVPDIRE